MVGHESHNVILEHFDCLAQFVLSSLGYTLKAVENNW